MKGVSMVDWEKRYGDKFNNFIDRIVELDPDYIVPITRKCAKLLRCAKIKTKYRKRIFYLEYFDFLNIPVENEQVVIVDDIVESGSTLSVYKDFFTQRGALDIRTIAFVAHEDAKYRDKKLFKKKNIDFYDNQMEEPHLYLSGPSFRDYVFDQARFLLEQGIEQDTNHIILEINAPTKWDNEKISTDIAKYLSKYGYTYYINTFKKIFRICVDHPRFFLNLSRIHPENRFFFGINKIRFYIQPNGLIFVPMCFPRIKQSSLKLFKKLNFPFLLPFQYSDIKSKAYLFDLYYLSISLFLSAELGRTFMKLLENDNNTVIKDYVDAHIIEIKNDDLIRYFGDRIGRQIAIDLTKYLFYTTYEPSEQLCRNLRESLDSVKVSRIQGSSSPDIRYQIISYLRQKYEEKWRELGTKKNSQFYLPLKELKRISGASYLYLNEIIDDDCDKGVLVPAINAEKGWIERVWRTGEPQTNEYKKSLRIIPLIIERHSKIMKRAPNKIPSLTLYKILANFIIDYPGIICANNLHCFYRWPSTFGPMVNIKRMGENLDLRDDHSDFIGFWQYHKGNGGNRSYFESYENAVDDLDEFFDNSQSPPKHEIISYFSFLIELIRTFGKVDILNSLAINRSLGIFLIYVNYNINQWMREYEILLDRYNILDFPILEKFINKCGSAVNSGLVKIKNYKDFSNQLSEIKNKFEKDIQYMDFVNKITMNIDYKGDYEGIKHFETVLMIQDALTGLALAKLFPKKSERTPEEIMNWADRILQKHGISLDLEKFKNTQNLNEVIRILRNFYFIVDNMVSNLQLPPFYEDELARMREREFNIDNYVVESLRESKWGKVCFLYSDLSKFSGEKENKVTPRLKELYYIHANEKKNHSNVHCWTKNPKGDDQLIYSSKNYLDMLRMAAHCQKKFAEMNEKVKMGISYSIYRLGEEWEYTTMLMGHAKDLCSLKTENFCNINKILVSQKLIDIIEEENISLRKYFNSIEGTFVKDRVILDEGIISQKKNISVYEFNWNRFIEEETRI